LTGAKLMESMSLSDEDRWAVADKYFGPNPGRTLVKHQLESFNDFVLRKLDAVIASFNPIEFHLGADGGVRGHPQAPGRPPHQWCLKLVIRDPVLCRPRIFEKDGSSRLMLPMDARLRNFTYAGNLCVNVHVEARTYHSATAAASGSTQPPDMPEDSGEYTTERRVLKNVSIGKIPLMVRSAYCALNNRAVVGSECRYDHGGYFVVNGNEKVVISQDKMAPNHVYVFASHKQPGCSIVAEVRSVNEASPYSVPKTTVLKWCQARMGGPGKCLRVSLHHTKQDVPLVVVMRALGVGDDQDIVAMVTATCDSTVGSRITDALWGTFQEAGEVHTMRDALEQLATVLPPPHMGYAVGQQGAAPAATRGEPVWKLHLVRRMLQRDFLPHMGSNSADKAVFLAYMARRTLRVALGMAPCDDRDSFVKKRVDSPGMLLGNLFRQFYGKLIKDLRNMVSKELNNGSWRATGKLLNVVTKVNVFKLLKSTIIESGMRYALSTGNWGVKLSSAKQGVAQVLNRMTYTATVSHLRRVNTPIEKSGKLVAPRKLHGTQWGVVCPCETPEVRTVSLKSSELH